ncbi:MAG: ATP-binding protein [Actinomycetota bacterium]
MTDPQTIAVTVPAGSEFLHIVRATVGSVAAKLDFTYEDVDDLRIAVDEACGELLSLDEKGDAKELLVAITPGEREVEISVSTDAAFDWPSDGLHGLPWIVMSKLVDEVQTGVAERGPEIRLRKHASPSP